MEGGLVSGPTTATIKALFALSSNRCAFPDCELPLVDPPSGKVTGRICHIKARSEGGPRYDPNQSDEERHGFGNLLLMCPVHHDVIDADPATYTVEKLLEIKRAHEALGVGGPEPGEDVVNQFLVQLNPFCDRGRINDPINFFDRDRILRELRQMLSNGSSVSLVGDSEIGKSSLMYHLCRTAAEWAPDARVCYVDLQGLLDEEDFCAEVLEELGREPGDLRALRRTLRRERVVLFLDEVEKLADPAFSSHLHHVLRSVAQEPTLALAVASHRPLVEVFPPSDPTSPFHNVFTEKRLGPFSHDEARAFLTHRLQETGMAFTPQEVEQLLTESGCHPARLQRRAYELFERKRS